MVSRLHDRNGIAKAVCRCTLCVPTLTMAPLKRTPLTESLASRSRSTKAICCPTAKCRPKPHCLVTKSAVRAVLVASVRKAVARDVVVVAAGLKPPRHLKENNHAATFTQKISQRAQRPQYWLGDARHTGFFR